MSNEHDYAYEAGYRDGSIHYELEHCPACKNIADLQEALDENSKLRELVRNLLRVIPRDVSGVVVGAHGEHPTYYSFADAMRELGVEVDE